MNKERCNDLGIVFYFCEAIGIILLVFFSLIGYFLKCTVVFSLLMKHNDTISDNAARIYQSVDGKWISHGVNYESIDQLCQ